MGRSGEKLEIQGITYSRHPVVVLRMRCGSTRRNQEGSSKNYYPRIVERINVNALKEVKVRGSATYFFDGDMLMALLITVELGSCVARKGKC